MTAGGDSPPHKTGDRVLIVGKSDLDHVDNSVSTSKYTAWSFFPVAVLEQFRRFANIYFLVIGFIMAIGYYTEIFDSAIIPWSTLGPLAIVISVSLAQEGAADIARHRSDFETNRTPCVILRREEDIEDSGGEIEKSILEGKALHVTVGRSRNRDEENGGYTGGGMSDRKVSSVAYEKVMRMNLRAGDVILVRNREMIPADLILLASSNEGGSAYIETSSIDGETNLKLRSSPQLPKPLLRSINEVEEELASSTATRTETLAQATKRITRMSCLGHPTGTSCLSNPMNAPDDMADEFEEAPSSRSKFSFRDLSKRIALRGSLSAESDEKGDADTDAQYVAVLTSEPPNASVNTYSGKLTLPPRNKNAPSSTIPLNAENILLRGAVLRNTEWIIGVACFTGTDTKLVKNSVATPSKFSRTDVLMNKIVALILLIMIACVMSLSSAAVYTHNHKSDQLWYVGLSENTSQPWPYLEGLEYPDWEDQQENWMQYFFLFLTLLNNFVPLSLYITVELVTLSYMVFINHDLDMYHDKTDTRAVARSTIVTDLGQVQYVFSDKTGTLTQNVMQFKRCSVDGMAFGAPIAKSAPQNADDSQFATQTSFHPLRYLLKGPVNVPKSLDESLDAARTSGLEGFGAERAGSKADAANILTFNAEMFLRVMSICHTVVVEKEIDTSKISGGRSLATGSSFGDNVAKYFRKRSSGDGDHQMTPVSDVSTGVPYLEGAEESSTPHGDAMSVQSEATSINDVTSVKSQGKRAGMGRDGSPAGYAYQAESPDEGALVSAASKSFGFQLIGRDSSGVQLSVSSSSLFQDENIVSGIKEGKLTPAQLAAKTASMTTSSSTPNIPANEGDRMETWEILAVNKFDSERKRMSVVVRSPPELGGIPMLLCKGADSSMLDPTVCANVENIIAAGDSDDAPDFSTNDSHEGNWDRSAMLGIQSHLGDFASEGLRTLVLGIRILTEDECASWLARYNGAAASIKNRSAKLKAAAFEIETGLHIVGATAIEDKLQDGVPDTIHKLEKAGIKLWVLTGDKRETAVEIGYSTKVLTPRMHLTQVADGETQKVRTQMAMEFMRLVKCGKLSQYQLASLNKKEIVTLRWLVAKIMEFFGDAMSISSRKVRKFFHLFIKPIFLNMCCGGVGEEEDPALVKIKHEEEEYANRLEPKERCRLVRKLAEDTIQEYLKTPEGRAESTRRGSQRSSPRKKMPPRNADSETDEEELGSMSVLPAVFSRAESAKALISSRRMSGNLSQADVRTLSLANETAQSASAPDFPLVDEDALSLTSFLPDGGRGDGSSFDRKKNSLLEQWFSVDKDVRHGRLHKHLRESGLDLMTSQSASQGAQGPRALVIEGAALSHFLGDRFLEEVLFSVASSCDAVIACRVSPKQKALVVNLVRNFVKPTPVTLAIGDGANDVGMIQEAHIGVGISGLEGQQAVNSSDFAIAQFRFLSNLLLIHGRWDFNRMSKVILFSFYKNACMAGCLIVFSSRTLYSGTTLFDAWVIAMLNFVAGLPILFLGIFDRDLEKDYVLAHPEVYASAQRNEYLKLRINIRWIIITIVHTSCIYFLSAPSLSDGGGSTSAFEGLMKNEDRDIPGDGEGGDLQVFGTTIYTVLIITLALKVLYETRSLVYGKWPAFTCRNGVGEGFWSRCAYTWHSVTWGSIIFYLFFIYMYSLMGRSGPGTFSPFVFVGMHMFNRRSITWLIIFLAPMGSMIFDVAGKMFSNMNFPTQQQIHMEICKMRRMKARKSVRESQRNRNVVEETAIQDGTAVAEF